jgi:hypothetical protein
MAADPILFVAGEWLGAASGLLAVLTVAGFVSRWGIRFRLVGVTSFTALLAMSVPIVFDNGADLVIAAPTTELPRQAWGPTAEQVARNLRGSGRTSADGHVRVRLRRVEAIDDGLGRPVILAEADRDLATGTVTVSLNP